MHTLEKVPTPVPAVSRHDSITTSGAVIEDRSGLPHPSGEAVGEQPPSATLFSTQRPTFADDGLMDLLLEEGVTVDAEPPDRVPLWQQLVLGFGPTLVLVALLVWLARRAGPSGLGAGLGRSKARRYSPEAEELVYGDVTTGAENDLDQATRTARQMVGRWGMSDAVGPVSVLPDPRTEQAVAVDGDGPAPGTRELVDAEVRRILDECYAEARDTLAQHRDRLDRLARALLAAETLDADQAHEAAGLPGPQDVVTDTLARAPA